MHTKKSDCLIIIAAYNEQDNIEAVVHNLIENYPGYDYLVVNDGSNDHTEKRCKQNGFNYCSLPQNLGIGGAIQTGYQYARENDYDIAIQLDGDGQHDPEYLDALVKPIRDGEADYVIGSRFIDKEGFQSTGLRRTGIRILSGMIYLFCHKKIADVTSGFRAVDRSYIKKFAMNYPTDYPEPEAIIDAALNGAVIKEIPVEMRERLSGSSSINLRRSIYYMIKVTLDIVVCRISYGVRRSK